MFALVGEVSDGMTARAIIRDPDGPATFPLDRSSRDITM